MGNSNGAGEYSHTEIDEFTSAYISSELKNKHKKLFQTAENVLRLSDIPFSVGLLHKETSKLLTHSIDSIKQQVKQQVPKSKIKSVTTNTKYIYYFSKNCDMSSLELARTIDGPIMTVQFPLECIISRKVCIRVLGMALAQAIKLPFQFRRKSGFLCTLRMPLPVQVNILIALGALGVYIKFHKKITGTKDGYPMIELKLTEQWPAPILPQMDAEALQFRTIFLNKGFLRSEYNISTNRFEWRKKTSYRYQELAYLKQNNMLMLTQPTEDVVHAMRMMDLNKQQQRTLYVEMEHHIQKDITIYFIGRVIDFIRKFDLLPNNSAGKMQLLHSRVHLFPLKQDMLVAKMKTLLNKTIDYEDKQYRDHNWRVNDLLRLPELGLRNMLKFLPLLPETSTHLPVYDPHHIVDQTATEQIQLQQRYLINSQQLSEQEAGIVDY